MKYIVIFLLCLSSILSIEAQELKVKVNVITPKLKTVDPIVFSTLEKSVTDFYNQTQWTEDEFEVKEKIEVNMQITIKDELTTETFVADIWITSLRPVYNSNYQTQMLNHIDKGVTFTYTPLQALENSKNTFIDNFSSILTFYAYIILGFDYDSFESLGGDVHFRTAQDIVSNIPSTVSDGDRAWQAVGGGDRNRYWLLENALSPRSRAYREAMYGYHRLGLDNMYDRTDEARGDMVEYLQEVESLERSNPNSMIVQMFTDSKRSEIIEIFKNATKKEQSEVYKIMSYIDPARASDYGIFK